MSILKFFRQTKSQLEAEFERDLRIMGLVFTKPASYEAVRPRKNRDVRYVYALRNSAGNLELRYMLRPIIEDVAMFQNWLASGNKETMILTDPNANYTTFINCVLMNIGGPNGSASQHASLSLNSARARFGADEISATTLTPASTFGRGFGECSVIAMFKRNIGLAFMFILYNPPAPPTANLEPVMQSLKFF